MPASICESDSVGFSIRNPLASDSMQRSLHQTLSQLTMAMADEGGQRLTASRKKRRNPQIRTKVRFLAPYSRQTGIFSLQIPSWISNGVCFLAQIPKPLDALRARLLLTSSCCEGLQDYACASKDCAVGLWGLVPYFDLRICHIRLVYWRVFDLLAPRCMPFAVLSCHALTEKL
jgi:hypothetical protein